jgi:hypothetical protein
MIGWFNKCAAVEQLRIAQGEQNAQRKPTQSNTYPTSPDLGCHGEAGN